MSSEKLVIVESPAKARTIGKILGGNYKIMASMGHIRDLPENSFGVDVKDNFKPKYSETKSKSNIIKQLRSEAKKADSIYLAPDPDREGEAIAWHLKEVLKKNAKAPFYRVTFHEITRNAINKAFSEPYDLNMNLVDSQQARRILDRLVGYQVSPLLWSKIERGISAGRVQSVALRLVCEREQEIIAFEPKEYWNFHIDLTPFDPAETKYYSAKLIKVDGEKADIGDEDTATKTLADIKSSPEFVIQSKTVKPRKKYAPPPFITSTLQQAASTYLAFSANFTMRVAQQLYEGIDTGNGPVGLITYMRTDSVNVAAEAQTNCRTFISQEYGADYISEKPNFFKSKSSAQEAHEAIRPTDVTLTPASLKSYLDDSQYRLYSLIWRRFVASQAAPAQQQQTTVDTGCRGQGGHDYLFRTNALVTTFPGFMKILNPANFEPGAASEAKEGENPYMPAILKELNENDKSFLKNLKNEQKFTEPPPRFSEATLIRELEANGIGRPSTYATIVSTIQKRAYVTKEKGRLSPTELGFKVNDFLVQTLPDLFQVGFTADMEQRLDKVEEGRIEWTDMLQEFYGSFEQWVVDAKKIGAPEAEKAGNLLQALEAIETWQPPEKKGRRTYDDHKFFNSVKDKFEKDALITEKQWLALLRIAVRYQEQVPNLDQVAEQYNFNEDIEASRQQLAELKKKEEELYAVPVEELKKKFQPVFDAFEGVTWEEPVKRGARTYDDSKFIESLKEQVYSGRILSERQMAAMQRIVLKYSEQMENFEQIASQLDIEPPSEEELQQKAEENKKIGAALETLSKVDNWNEPVKKGRRVYDDKAFYESLKKQYDGKKALSARQVGALFKLVAKYAG